MNYNANMALLGLLNTQESLRVCKQQGWAADCSLWKVGQGLENADQSSRVVDIAAQLADPKTEAMVNDIGFTNFWTELYEIRMSLDPQIEGVQQGKSLDRHAFERLLTRLEQADFPSQVQVGGWEKVRESIKKFMDNK